MRKIYIIAEAGVNHNGSLELAKQLALTAKEANADAVKFQTFNSEAIVSRIAEKADYQKEVTCNSESQLEMIKRLELSADHFIQLNKYCADIGIEFLSTPFDIESIKFLNQLNMKFWKIPSGEVTNLPYLLQIAKTHKPVVMSTGMCEIFEIEDAIEILRNYGTEEITLLHCNTEYPTPFEDANISAIVTMKEHFGMEVGYSDHTKGIEAVIAAAALGASIIEKHFTLDRNMEGPDHKASLEPRDLKEMVSSIRNIELALGTGIKKPTVSESKNKIAARKSITAKVDIQKGDIFSEDNVTTKRPGNGLPPTKWFEVIGQKAKRNYIKDELIEL